MPNCKYFLVTEADRSISSEARDFNNIEKRAIIKVFSSKARRLRKFTPFRQKY